MADAGYDSRGSFPEVALAAWKAAAYNVTLPAWTSLPAPARIGHAAVTGQIRSEIVIRRRPAAGQKRTFQLALQRRGVKSVAISLSCIGGVQANAALRQSFFSKPAMQDTLGRDLAG